MKSATTMYDCRPGRMTLRDPLTNTSIIWLATGCYKSYYVKFYYYLPERRSELSLNDKKGRQSLYVPVQYAVTGFMTLWPPVPTVPPVIR